jgi:hypothetical protein
MDAATARTALHHWIDQADDAIVIGLATLSAQLKAAIEQKNEQQLQARGRLPTVDPPQTPGEWWASARQRRDEADRQGRAASAARMRQDVEERAGKAYAPMYMNGEGQRTDEHGQVLPPEDA